MGGVEAADVGVIVGQVGADELFVDPLQVVVGLAVVGIDDWE
jgi:hypothetical protein